MVLSFVGILLAIAPIICLLIVRNIIYGSDIANITLVFVLGYYFFITSPSCALGTLKARNSENTMTFSNYSRASSCKDYILTPIFSGSIIAAILILQHNIHEITWEYPYYGFYLNISAHLLSMYFAISAAALLLVFLLKPNN